MSKREDFGRPEKPLEKAREIDNEARISKKAEMKRKFNRNHKRITLWDIQLSSLTSLVILNKLIELKYVIDYFKIALLKEIEQRINEETVDLNLIDIWWFNSKRLLMCRAWKGFL